jgi:transposase
MLHTLIGVMITPSGAVRIGDNEAGRLPQGRGGGLAALVRETVQANPFDGAIYVFRAKRADRIKLVYWDGTGVCLLAKRLEEREFRRPNIQNGVIRLSAAGFSALLEGLDWRRVHASRAIAAPAQPG